MFSTVSSGMGATVCTAGRFLLVAPLTKLEDEEAEGAASVAPVREEKSTYGFDVVANQLQPCNSQIMLCI